MKTFIAVLAAGLVLLVIVLSIQSYRDHKRAEKCEVQRHTAALFADNGYSYSMDPDCT